MKRSALGAMCLVVLAGGCTRQLSRGLADDGSVQSPVFANPRFLRADGGSYPDPATLTRLGPGLNKTQLLDLIGPPHFREGFAAREWDYLFLFRTPDGDRSCQYKVVFDRQYRARSLHWQPATCEGWVAARGRGHDAGAAGQAAPDVSGTGEKKRMRPSSARTESP